MSNTSIQVGNSVISDGLKLLLEPASIRSYEGEPTENLVTQPLNPDSWSANTDTSYGFISKEVIDTPFGEGLRWVVEGNNYRATMIRPSTGSRVTVTPGMYYTSSLYARTPLSGGITFALQGRDSNGDRTDASSRARTLTDEWTRYETTWFMDNFNLADIDAYMKLYLRGLSSSGLGVIEIACPQVELKPYATPFTPTSRPETEVLKDLSGNNHHFDFVGDGPFPSVQNNNMVNFGFENYAVLINANAPALDFGKNDSFTISAWFRVNELHETGSRSCIINKSAGSNSFGISIEHNGLSIGVRASSGSRAYYTSQSIWSIDRFHNAVLAYSPGVMRVYVDGIIVREILNPISELQGDFKNDSAWTIASTDGLGGDAREIDTDIGQIAIYNRMLSDDEVLHNFVSHKSRFGL